MNPDFVQLDRHFSKLSEKQEEADYEIFGDIWVDSQSKSWSQIEDEYRIVILAEAGAGKTEEMKQRALHGVDNKRYAFFIRIEDIDSDFENAFEVGDQLSFENWLASGHEAWFYLDSVDEARLKDPAAFRMAIKRFANRIKFSAQRAHIVISSRPYAWQPRSDRALMDEVLYLPSPESQDSQNDESVDRKKAGRSALQVFRLKPLDKSRARIFTEDRGVNDFERLWTEIERLDLSDLAERPFDLEAITSKWKGEGTLSGRLKLLRHIIDQRLSEINPDRERRQPLGLQKSREGARLLAAAVMLTGEAGIRVPDAASTGSGIEAKELLLGWDANDIRALLERAIFNDVIFGAVRFRHRETRELLAAEWFLELLKSGTSRHSIEALFFRKQYGAEIISPRLRPILPWLILFDDNIRNRTLEIDPGIVVEGGDPPELPLSIRKRILSSMVARLASKQGRGASSYRSATARIAQHDLADDVIHLIDQHAASDDAIEFLAGMVWQGEMSSCVSSLLHFATASDRSNRVRIVTIRALMTCGTDEQKLRLWRLILKERADIPRTVAAELVRYSSSGPETVCFVLGLLEKAAAYERFNTTGLNQALHEFINRFRVEKSASDNQNLVRFIRGLNGLLEQAPHIEGGEFHISDRFAWLLGPATQAVEKLVANRLDSAMSDEAIAVMLKVPLARFWTGEEYGVHKDRLRELIPDWPELNDYLFWASVETARAVRLEISGEPMNDDWPVQWPGHYWRFGADGFPRAKRFIETREREDDKLVAVSLSYRIAEISVHPERLGQLESAVAGNSILENRLRDLRSPSVSEATLKWRKQQVDYEHQQEEKRQRNTKDRADWIDRLRRNPELVLRQPGLEPGNFSSDQYWLLKECNKSRQQTGKIHSSDWRSLIGDFGQSVAAAFREAAIAHWRLFRPGLRSEGADTAAIPYSLIFAMVGIDIEALETPRFPFYLHEQEVKHALRYITWELNGFPSWLEAMHRSFPEQVISAIQTELYWELANTISDQPMHYILHDLACYAPWLHSALVEPLLDWTLVNEVPSRDALGHVLCILKGGGVRAETMVLLAKKKISSSSIVSDLPYWYAMWVDAEPETGIIEFEEWLDGLSEEQGSLSAQIFIVVLMGNSHYGGARSAFGNFRSVQNLKALYVLMHRYIRVSGDMNRAGTGGYSPELRDDAQDARNMLFNLLSSIRGKETYIALKELGKEHPDLLSRPWMEKAAYRHAEADGELELWTAPQVAQFAADKTRFPGSHRQLFDMGVSRLIDLKNWLEQGNDSPFRTWQRVADETEMRNLVAGWLNTQSGSRFTCAQENELSNKQRPDIFLQSPNVASAVPIELKLLDRKWTGPKLCERLRNQLAGDYLREETAGCGVMLLISQGGQTERCWEIGGKSIGISSLRDALMEYWESISDAFSNVSAIEVIVVDLTIRALKSER